jgi:hypothetical protein
MPMAKATTKRRRNTGRTMADKFADFATALAEIRGDLRIIREQMGAFIADKVRLEERVVTLFNKSDAYERDLGALFDRVRALETSGAKTDVREGARGDLLKNVVYPLAVAVLVLVAGYLFTTRPAGGEDAPSRHEAPAQ